MVCALSSWQWTTMEGYLRDNQRKNAGTPMLYFLIGWEEMMWFVYQNRRSLCDIKYSFYPVFSWLVVCTTAMISKDTLQHKNNKFRNEAHHHAPKVKGQAVTASYQNAHAQFDYSSFALLSRVMLHTCTYLVSDFPWLSKLVETNLSWKEMAMTRTPR